MARPDVILKKLRQICLALPDTKETETWGKPHFRVGDKIFAGCGEEDGKFVVGFKLEMQHARQMIRIPGFWKAPYVGHKGWVSMDASVVSDWELVRELIHESYRLIAPKRTLAKLESTEAVQAPTERRARGKGRTPRKHR